MRVNGHSYFLDNDINTGIIEFWQNNKDDIEIDIEDSDDVQSINFPDSPSYIKYIPNSTDNKLVTTEIFFADVELNIKLKSLKWWRAAGAWLSCPFSGGNMKIDIMISVDFRIGVDTSGVYLEKIGEMFPYIAEIDCDAGFPLLVEVLEDKLSSGFENNISDSVPLKVTVIPIDKFTESGYGIVDGVDPVQEIQDLMDSFPIDISIGSLVYENEKILIINLSLMPGYGNNLSFYENGSPQLPQNPVLNLSGIAMNGDKYRFYPGNANSWQDEITGVHDIIQNELGLTHVRVEALWKYVCPILPSIDESKINDYPAVTPQTIVDFNQYIDDLIQNTPPLPGGNSQDKIGWQWLDIVMNDLATKNLTPLLIIGQGLSTSVPYAENAFGEYKIIAPGEPRGVNTGDYIGISEEMYLYWR